jgi:hypothetical protein
MADVRCLMSNVEAEGARAINDATRDGWDGARFRNGKRNIARGRIEWTREIPANTYRSAVRSRRRSRDLVVGGEVCLDDGCLTGACGRLC